MKFVCFGYIKEIEWNLLAQKEQSKILNEYFNFNQKLRQDGIFLNGIGLKPVSESLKISVVEGQIKASSLEPKKEQIGGFLVIEAKDLMEAESIISRHPGLKIGTFEIRVIDKEITELVGAN